MWLAVRPYVPALKGRNRLGTTYTPLVRTSSGVPPRTRFEQGYNMSQRKSRNGWDQKSAKRGPSNRNAAPLTTIFELQPMERRLLLSGSEPPAAEKAAAAFEQV